MRSSSSDRRRARRSPARCSTSARTKWRGCSAARCARDSPAPTRRRRTGRRSLPGARPRDGGEIMNIDWLSAVGMLLAGLIVGFMFVYSMRRRDGKSDLETRDLEAKRDALLAALREGVETPEERAKLERETADVLRALDARSSKRPRGTAAAPAAHPVPPPAPARGS